MSSMQLKILLYILFIANNNIKSYLKNLYSLRHAQYYFNRRRF